MDEKGMMEQIHLFSFSGSNLFLEERKTSSTAHNFLFRLKKNMKIHFQYLLFALALASRNAGADQCLIDWNSGTFNFVPTGGSEGEILKSITDNGTFFRLNFDLVMHVF